MSFDAGSSAAAPSQDTGAQTTDAGTSNQTQTTWRDTLPEDLKASPVLAKYQDPHAAFKALVDAQELIGRKSEGLVKPGPDAKPEDVAKFYKALGRPDTPDAYAMPEVKDMPEGYGLLPEVEKIAREGLHGLGLTQDQFKGAMELLTANSIKEIKAKHALQAAESKAFTEAHGDKAKDVLESAARVIRSIGGDDLIKALQETEAVNRKVVMEAFASMAPHFVEGGAKGGPAGSAGTKDYTKLSPSERIAQGRKDGYT